MEIFTLAERPDLEPSLWSLTSEWPEFMLHDPIADLYYSRLDRWAEYGLVAVENGEAVARAFSVPVAFGAHVGRLELPADGWDGVVLWSHFDDLTGQEPMVVAGLEITIRSDLRGTGLASRMLEALRANADRMGFNELVLPVRPSRKHLEPRTPIGEYAARRRPDGLPEDPWMRLHVRAGGEIIGVCPTAMAIPGTLDQWREWTGLPFDTSGDVDVPGALSLVHVDVDQNHAVYIEPNVWIRHRWATS